MTGLVGAAEARKLLEGATTRAEKKRGRGVMLTVHVEVNGDTVERAGAVRTRTGRDGYHEYSVQFTNRDIDGDHFVRLPKAVRHRETDGAGVLAALILQAVADAQTPHARTTP